jgi:predicted ABC-type ATPase
MVYFVVNVDLIAGGLSPLKPQVAAIAAARMVLREIDRLAAQRVEFAFETTLSGLNYARRLRGWKRAGYRVCGEFAARQRLAAGSGLDSEVAVGIRQD